MKTNYVPAIIMLIAGLIDSVMSIYYRLNLYDFTKRLLLVLVIFYILGIVVKIILDINFPKENELQDEIDAATEQPIENEVENIDTEEESEINDTEE